MFLVDVAPATYADPWRTSFEERLAALSRGQRRVAYYYENPDNSTFRYRVYNMIQVLQESRNGNSAAYFTHQELDDLDRVIDVADVLVVCRSRYNHKLNHAITKARNKGKPVFFDVDDLVFDPAYAHLVLNTLDQDPNHPDVWDTWFAYMGRLGGTLSLCDRVITTNDHLAAKIQARFEKPIGIIPNFLNREQLEISRKVYQEKVARGFARDDQIHLGYFSGTPTHNKDFDIVSDALVRLLETDPRIVLRVVGFLDLKGPLQKYGSRTERYPLQDFENLQRLIGQVEVNLIPLQDNVFTKCKSELKYFEAGIVGTVSIASPIYTLAKAIRDGENGYLSRSFEWSDKLATLIDGIESYPSMAEKAFSDCEQKYAWYKQVDLVEGTLFR